MPLTTGTKLGHYEIGPLIGAGGMGEVYRARDVRIGREVAVKIITPGVSADPQRLQRFEQEARNVGALNHPNLVTLFDLGSFEGAPYLVMELLEGETLREKISSSETLSSRKAVEYAVQIAEGLAAAHQKGVVHRDLKPENVFVTRDGRVKILDFGLAKLLGTSGGSDSNKSETVRLKTDPGTVMGTVGYMSPEQVRGLEVDHRSDIFSFGAILYEMLSGQRAFRRNTGAETMTAILREDPPELALASSGVSRMLEAVTRHCLEKAPENRFQSARDLAFDLSMFSISASVVAPAGIEEPAKRSWKGVVAAALLLTGIAAAFAVGRMQREPSLAPIRYSTIAYSGSDWMPAVSPDGKMIAFASVRDGVSRIWLKQLNGGGEAVLTSGPDFLPRFSPDGSSILFIRGSGITGGLFRIPVLGGEPRKIAERVASADWSPDGQQVVFARPDTSAGNAHTTLGILDVRRGKERVVKTIDRPIGAPRWSPDGQWISYSSNTFGNTSRDVSVIGLDGKERRGVTLPKLKGFHSPQAWVGNDQLVFSSTEAVTNLAGDANSKMVLFDLRNGGEKILFFTPTSASTVDVAPDGSLLFDAVAPRQNMLEISLSGDTSPGWISRGSSIDRQPVYSPDGKWIAFSSSMSGNLDIWARSMATGTLRRITEDEQDDFDPAFTPDGQSLVWSSRRSGNYEIWIANVDGTSPRQLTKDGVDAENPTATRDGWVVYNSYHPAKTGLWRIRIDGSKGERLLVGATQLPETSPDGAYVTYHLLTTNDLMVMRISDRKTARFRKGIEISTDSINFGRTRWTSDGKGVVFHFLSPDNAVVLARQDFLFGVDTSSTARMLVGTDIGPPESFGFSPDGTKVAVSHQLGEVSIKRSEPIAELAPRSVQK